MWTAHRSSANTFNGDGSAWYAAAVHGLGPVDLLCSHVPPAVPELAYDVAYDYAGLGLPIVSVGASAEHDHFDVADSTGRVRLGEVVCRVVATCARCQVTTIDQETGVRTGQPLKGLGLVGGQRRGARVPEPDVSAMRARDGVPEALAQAGSRPVARRPSRPRACRAG